MTSHDSPDPSVVAPGATLVAARLARAAARAETRLDAIIADVLVDDAVRLDEEARAAVIVALEVTVRAAASAICTHAARLLAETAPEAAVRLAANPDPLLRLHAAGVLADRELMRAVVADARVAVIEESLLETRGPEDMPLLLPRLADHRDPIVRDRATAFLLADSRRRRDGPAACELPAECAHRLAWLVAAALADTANDASPAVPRALIDATLRHLAAQDEDRYAGAVAIKLAAALDLPAAELGATLIEVLVEGRLRLFAALVAHAAGVDLPEATAATLDPDPGTLLTCLRACGLERADLARIGLRLADADRARDAEALADEVDAAAALTAEAARAAIDPLTLERDYRAAARVLARG